MLLKSLFLSMLFSAIAHASEFDRDLESQAPTEVCKVYLQITRYYNWKDLERFPFKKMLAELEAGTADLIERRRIEKESFNLEVVDRILDQRKTIAVSVRIQNALYHYDEFETWDELAKVALNDLKTFEKQLKAEIESRGYTSLEDAFQRLPPEKDENRDMKTPLDLAKNVYTRLYRQSYLDCNDLKFSGLVRWNELFSYLLTITTFRNDIQQPDALYFVSRLKEYVEAHWDETK